MPTLASIQNRKVKLTGNKRLPTMNVRRIADDRIVLINIGMFDSILYAKIEKGADTTEQQSDADRLAAQVAARAHMAKILQEQSAHKYGKTDMAKMKVEALKEFPEWSRIPEGKRDKTRNKEQVIDLILAHRL